MTAQYNVFLERFQVINVFVTWGTGDQLVQMSAQEVTDPHAINTEHAMKRREFAFARFSGMEIVSVVLVLKGIQGLTVALWNPLFHQMTLIFMAVTSIIKASSGTLQMWDMAFPTGNLEYTDLYIWGKSK